MKYDPQKSYTWQPEDKFELSGSQLGMILNTFRAVLSSPLILMIKNIEQANIAVEEIMANGVEVGIIKELQMPKKADYIEDNNKEENEKV
jgi:hypothetical protein